MPPQDPCPPCKIIIDGGRIGAAAHSLATLLPFGTLPHASAVHLSEMARATVDALSFAMKRPDAAISSEWMDFAHATSELWCHRAATIEGWVATIGNGKAIPSAAAAKLALWSDEMRTAATGLFGGEYDEERGGYQIIGNERIEKKENA